MALTENGNGNGMIMPVAPMYGGGYGGGMGGIGFGGDWAWILLLLVLGGGWGGFGGFGMGGAGAMMGMGMMGMDYLYPWLNNSEHISDGFRDAQLSNQVGNIQNAVTSGFGDVQNALCAGFGNVQNSLCGGFAGVNASINGAQNAIAQQLYTNQISDLERSFAAQTANTQGMTALQAQLANCCCENRAATADLKYTVATENCQDRYEAAQNTQGIISAITAGIQSIKDDLCADRVEAERRENANLRTQLSMAQLAASQSAQTATIQAGQRALANEVEQYVAPKAIPAYVVQNPNCCAPTSCGCGSF
jgi:hypothetical protein